MSKPKRTPLPLLIRRVPDERPHFRSGNDVWKIADTCFDPALHADPDRLLTMRPVLEAALREADNLLDFEASATLDPHWSATLGRLNRSELQAVRLNLNDLLHKTAAIELIRCHLPTAMAGVEPEAEWPRLLGDFLHHIEGLGWFEVNWNLLDWLWEIWMNEFDPQAECGLADYLTGIPVTCYGLNDNDLIEHPILSLINILLGGDPVWIPDVISGYSEANIDTERLYLALTRADLSRYPEPLRSLLQVAAVITGETGNILLDTVDDPADWWPHRFTWEADLERVKAAWAEAAPLVEAVRALCDWCAGAPGYEREREVAHIILETGNYLVPTSNIV